MITRLYIQIQLSIYSTKDIFRFSCLYILQRHCFTASLWICSTNVVVWFIL